MNDDETKLFCVDVMYEKHDSKKKKRVSIFLFARDSMNAAEQVITSYKKNCGFVEVFNVLPVAM